MYQFPIGVMLESFRLENDREAVAKAAEVGAQGIQMYATGGAHAPENMNAAARREMVDLLASHGLRFSALCGDLGHGFGNAYSAQFLLDFVVHVHPDAANHQRIIKHVSAAFDKK